MHIFFVKLCAHQTSLRLFGDWHTTPCDFHYQRLASKQKAGQRGGEPVVFVFAKKKIGSVFFSFVCLFVFSSVFVFVFALSQAASQVGWQGGSVPVVLLGFKEEIRLTPKFGPIKRHSCTAHPSSSSSPSSVTAHHHQQQKAAIICEHIFRFVHADFYTLNSPFSYYSPQR